VNSRESIYAALFALVSAVATFKTTSRRLKAWTEIDPADQPAFFQVQKSEGALTQTGQPTRWKMECELVFYVNTGGDESVAPSSIFNPIVDAVVALFDPKVPTQTQTLGGLVHYARINGSIQTDEGILGSQAFVMIPIEIMTA
jgi:hypothetical protein